MALPVRYICQVNLPAHEESGVAGSAPRFAFVLHLPLVQGRTSVAADTEEKM